MFGGVTDKPPDEEVELHTHINIIRTERGELSSVNSGNMRASTLRIGLISNMTEQICEAEIVKSDDTDETGDKILSVSSEIEVTNGKNKIPFAKLAASVMRVRCNLTERL